MKHASRARTPALVEAPLTWAFDGRFPASLADLEDTLRRAIVQVGDVARVLVVIELSLPALKARLAAGDQIQPAWGEFMARVATRYGLPAAPRRFRSSTVPLRRSCSCAVRWK